MALRPVYVPTGGGMGAGLKERKRITERLQGRHAETPAARRERLRRIRGLR